MGRIKTYKNPLDFTSASTDIVLYCRYPLRLEPYEGCQHDCRYCYVPFIKKRRVAKFTEVFPSDNIIDVLDNEWRLKGAGQGKLSYGIPLRISAMTDPLQLPEKKYRLTEKTLLWLQNHPYPFIFVTKSNRVAKDPYLTLLSDLNEKTSMAVSMTITTNNEGIRKELEPGASTVKNRLRAMKKLSDSGIRVCARIQPLLPYITDDLDDLEIFVGELKDVGVKHITSEFLKIDSTEILKRIKGSITSRNIEEKYTNLFGISNENKKVGAYWRAKTNYRWKKLSRLSEICKKEGLTFGTCKEGFYELHTTDDCCGALLPGIARPTAHDVYEEAKRRKEVSLEHVMKDINTPYIEKFINLWKSGLIEKRIRGLSKRKKGKKVVYYRSL